MKKVKGISSVELVITIGFSVLVGFIIFNMFIKRFDNNVKDNRIYQEVTSYGGGKYIQCIDGNKYMITENCLFCNSSQLKLTNNNGFESCEIKLYNYEQAKSESAKNNGISFIQIN